MCCHPARLFSATLLAALALLAVAGCDFFGDRSGDGTFDGDVQAILENEARGVALATYQNLDSNADTLQRAVQALADTASASTLDAAQAAWRSAHRPGEQREGFRFGPTAEPNTAAALDRWPADTTGIQTILDGSASITEARIAALAPGEAGTRKGFHALEFLLFGGDGQKAAEDFTEREIAYLTAAAAVLEAGTQALLDVWSGEGGAAEAFANAGREGSPYSRRGALDRLVNSMDGTVAEVGGRIGTVLSDAPAFRVESAYSENTFVDFRNHLRAFRHLYTGDYDGRAGPGLDEIVKDVRAGLDERMQSQIARAIGHLSDLYQNYGSVRAAVEEDREGVRAARDAILDLRDTVQQDLAPLIADLRL